MPDIAIRLYDHVALATQIQLMDPFQLYWTTSKGGSLEVQAEDQDVMYHVRLHNVVSAL